MYIPTEMYKVNKRSAQRWRTPFGRPGWRRSGIPESDIGDTDLRSIYGTDTFCSHWEWKPPIAEQVIEAMGRQANDKVSARLQGSLPLL